MSKSSALRRPRPRGGHKDVIAQAPIILADETPASDTSLSPATQASASVAQPRSIQMASDTQTLEKKERRQNLTYTYRDKDGQEVEKFTDDARSVIYMVDASGKKVELSLLEIVKDQSVIDWLAENAPIMIRGALFGFKTTVGNAVTSVKNGSADEMLQAIENRKETLVEGEWREGGERGPSPKLVLEAMLQWYRGKTGKDPSEAKQKAFKDTIRKEGTKKILTDADILAEFEAVKLREQQKRVDEAKAQAQGANQVPTAMDALLAD